MVLTVETEQILDAQEELLKLTEKLAKNFKKDGAKRKTIVYLQSKMETITAYCNEFQDNHSILIAAPDLPFNDDYLKKNYKTQFETMAQQFIDDLKATASNMYPGQDIFDKAIIRNPAPSNDQGIINIRAMLNAFNQAIDDYDALDPLLKTPEKMQEVRVELRSNWKRITDLHSRLIQEVSTYDAILYLNMEKKIKAYVHELGSLVVEKEEMGLSPKTKQSTLNLKLMLEAFNELLDDFNVLDNALKNHDKLKATSHRLRSRWNVISELHSNLLQESTMYDATLFVDIEKKLKTFVPQLGDFDIYLTEPTQPQIINPTNGSSDNLKLPKITIPIFEGDYTKWCQFEELFMEMVGSKNISGTQKLLYLKQNVHGEASTLVNHLMLTEDNYDVAWQILRTRYANKRLIVTKLIDKISTAEQIKVETAESVKKMHDTVSENIRVLRSMNISDSELLSNVLHYMVIKKLDETSRQLYEQSLTDSRAIPDIDVLLDFAVKRFQALEAVGTKNKHITLRKHNSVYEKSLSLITSDGNGYHTKLCDCTETHPIYNCSKFLAATPRQRYGEVKRLGLCTNCLKEGHIAKLCSARNCNNCEGKHNSLLHYGTSQA